jgi:hypothetical protein
MSLMGTTSGTGEPDVYMRCWGCDGPIPRGQRYVDVDYRVEHAGGDGWIDVDYAESIITACMECVPSAAAVREVVEAIPVEAAAPAGRRLAADRETLCCGRCGRVFAPGERHVTVDYSVGRQVGEVSVTVDEACWLIMRCLGCAPGRDAVIAAFGLPARPGRGSAAAVLTALDGELDEGVRR